jgi:cytochrome c
MAECESFLNGALRCRVDADQGLRLRLVFWCLMRTTIALSLVIAFLGPAFAQSGNVAVGERFARTNCATCHAVGRVGESPLRIAPPLRELHHKYPVEHLAESLAEGIMTGHPTMPQFRLEPDEIGHFIAYLKTLER